MQFLKGLNAFGRGQWKQISRYYVPSRTPTQVASHAQKHFLRVTGNAKRKSKFAAVDALAELHFGSGSDGSARNGSSHPQTNIPVRKEKGNEATPAKRRHASSDARAHPQMQNHSASDDTGSARPAFANGMSLYHPTSLGGHVVPPVQPDGVALGIPLQEIPDLPAFGGKNLPMLKVIKGRIPATSNLFRPSSPSPSQKKTHEEDEPMESEGGSASISRRKRGRRFSNLKEGGFESALEALADVAAGLADGRAY